MGPPTQSCDVPGAACMTGKEGFGTKPHAGSGVPTVGVWIYVPTMMSISHGWDDVAGGLAQVTKVESMAYNGGDHWISVAQHDRRMSWKVGLRDEQEKLRKRHGTELARRAPDYHDPGADDGWQSLPRRGSWP